MYSFGKRLRQTRMHSQVSQVNFAKKIGVAKSTLSLYESDKREPPIRTIRKITCELGTSADYLLGIEDNPSFSLSEFEKQLLLQFRRKKDLQKAVCLLLEVDPDDWYFHSYHTKVSEPTDQQTPFPPEP